MAAAVTKAVVSALAALGGWAVLLVAAGMAPGVDIWAAEIVLEKKKHNTALHLICAVPHPGFENKRGKYEKNDICT